MSSSDGTAEAEVRVAAGRLLAAFAASDLDGYFGSFRADAVFLFHKLPGLIESTAAYRAAWAGWVRDVGLSIDGCESHDQKVHFVTSGVALFTHAVTVRARTRDGPDIRHERETIVFAREPDGRWLGVHEHLSADPDGGGGTT